MFATIATFLTSSAFGAITGIIGNIFTQWTNLKIQREKNRHEENMMVVERENMQAEAEANIKITQATYEGKVQLADAEAFKESYKMLDKSLFSDVYMRKLMDNGKWYYPRVWVGMILSFLFGLVDFLKHAARPILTYYLVGATTWVTILCYNIIILASNGGAALNIVQALSLFEIIVSTLIYLTSTCVTWWFGDRRNAKFQKRLNDGNMKWGG